MEYVERYNLDPALAYTPKINAAIEDAIEKENVQFYMDEMGVSEVEAKTMARNHRQTK